MVKQDIENLDSAQLLNLLNGLSSDSFDFVQKLIDDANKYVEAQPVPDKTTKTEKITRKRSNSVSDSRAQINNDATKKEAKTTEDLANVMSDQPIMIFVQALQGVLNKPIEEQQQDLSKTAEKMVLEGKIDEKGQKNTILSENDDLLNLDQSKKEKLQTQQDELKQLSTNLLNKIPKDQTSQDQNSLKTLSEIAELSKTITSSGFFLSEDNINLVKELLENTNNSIELDANTEKTPLSPQQKEKVIASREKITRSLIKVAQAIMLSLGVGATFVSGAAAAGLVSIPASVAISTSVAAVIAGGSALTTVGLGIKIAYDNAESIRKGAAALFNAICTGAKITVKTPIAISAVAMRVLKEFVCGVVNFAIASPLKKIFINTPSQVVKDLKTNFDWVSSKLKPKDRDTTRDNKENVKKAIDSNTELQNEFNQNKENIKNELEKKYSITLGDNMGIELTQSKFVNFMQEIGGRENYTKIFKDDLTNNITSESSESKPNDTKIISDNFYRGKIEPLLNTHLENKALERCVKSIGAKLLAHAGHTLAHAPMFTAVTAIAPIVTAYATVKSLGYEFTIGVVKDTYRDVKNRVGRIGETAQNYNPTKPWAKKASDSKSTQDTSRVK